MAINSISHQDVTEEALLICQIEELEVRRAYSSHKSLVTDYVYACLSVKNIGKQCAGEPQARFDEGGLEIAAMVRLLRHRQTKETETDKPSLKRQ